MAFPDRLHIVSEMEVWDSALAIQACVLSEFCQPRGEAFRLLRCMRYQRGSGLAGLDGGLVPLLLFRSSYGYVPRIAGFPRWNAFAGVVSIVRCTLVYLTSVVAGACGIGYNIGYGAWGP